MQNGRYRSRNSTSAPRLWPFATGPALPERQPAPKERHNVHRYHLPLDGAHISGQNDAAVPRFGCLPLNSARFIGQKALDTMAGSYIPQKEALLKVWVTAFSTLITANPTDYGLVVGDATAISTPVNAFVAAYTTATTPGTRTSVTIAAKDQAKAAMLLVVRSYAQQIRNSKTVSDALKLGLGLTLPDYVPTPVPAPTEFPMINIDSAGPLTHSIRYAPSGNPMGHAKPAGSIGMLLFREVGAVAVADAAALPFHSIQTKQPIDSSFQQADIGKVASYSARFYSRSGKLGPWSQVTTFVVTG